MNVGLDTIIHGASQILQALEIPVGSSAQQIPYIYEFMPSAAPQTPCFILHPDETMQDFPHLPMQQKLEHIFVADLYYAQGDSLSNADAVLRPYMDIVIETLNHHIQLGGTCLNSGVTGAAYGGFAYPAGTDNHYLGIRFTIRAVEFKQFIYHA